MNKAKLILLACPALLTSIMLVNPVNATDQALTDTTNIDVSVPATPIFEVVFEQENSEDALDFTDQESDDAIARYGCDCPRHLNAIRQLQGKLPLL